MKKSPKPKKRNPQDSTLRNVRASKARLDAIDDRIASLHERVTTLETPLPHVLGTPDPPA